MKIEKFKKEKDKYKIYLNDGQVIETYEDIIIAENLLLKKEINEDEIIKLNLKTSYTSIINKIQKLIGLKYRSEKWVRDYLNKTTDFNKELKEKIIKKLKDTNFIDDDRYALAYTNDKINLSLDGPYKIINDLSKENIMASDIVLKQYTSEIIENNITKIITKKCRENKKYAGYILEKRICDYLKNMGYSQEEINLYKHLINYDNTIIEKEFEKAYKKYSAKLKDENLYRKIKQILYTHGISNDQIEQLIDKKRLEEN